MGSRLAIFLATVLAIWAGMHAYVFWRLHSVPWMAAHLGKRGLAMIAILLWTSYPLARILEFRNLDWLALPLEYLAAIWIGVLFLLFAAFLVFDVATLGGWLVPGQAGQARGWVAVVVAGLAVIALVQALRPPVLRDYEVRLPGLPPEHDGLSTVVISDLHLGTMMGRTFAGDLIRRVNDLQPGLVLVVGDVIDGNVERVEPLVPTLQQLRAPLGVWAVTGNHEYYAGIEESVRLLERAGWTVLRDRAATAAPGLIIAGVDDLTARPHLTGGEPVIRALANRPAGATILLSHTPRDAKIAAEAGAGLMLSGHTHNGQIWPFSFLVRLRYPLLGGRYELSGMPLIVCRGTGTWGPRMRLWRPSEFLRITLRS